MSGTDDLNKLLQQLKSEVGPLPPEVPAEQPRRAPRELPARETAPRPLPRGEKSFRPRADGRPMLSAPQGGNMVWSENKEAMLFGMLASLLLVMGGVLAGLDYLIIVGAVVFLLFSFMMLLALFGYYLNFRRSRQPEVSGLAEKVDSLARKVEMLSGRAAAAPQERYAAPASEHERDLERRIEELRVIVKTLARGEGNNR